MEYRKSESAILGHYGPRDISEKNIKRNRSGGITTGTTGRDWENVENYD